jgi:MoaA/NifB/PqqE/SkfB family radical SAM enzyme
MYITLYGSSDKTYNIFTKTIDQMKHVKENILKLADAGIKVKIKTVLNKYNEREIEDIKLFADKNKLNYRLYTTIIGHGEIDCANNIKEKVIENQENALYIKISRYQTLKLSDVTKENSYQ